MASTCKTCGASIEWKKTASGQTIPLDTSLLAVVPDPEADPLTVIIDRRGEVVRGRRVAMSEGHRHAVLGRVSHFATCPDADEHRRAGGRR